MRSLPHFRFARRFTPSRRSRLAAARGKSRVREARTAVLSGLAGVVACFLGLAVRAESARPNWYDPDGALRLREFRQISRWRDADAPARTLCVAVGSSRMQMALSPNHLGLAAADPAVPVVYNLGHIGYDPVGQMLTVRRLLDAGLKPDYLLVEIMPLTQTREKVPPSVTAAGTLGHADLSRLAPYVEDPNRLRREWAAARLVSWSTLRFNLMDQWGGGEWILPRLRQYTFQSGLRGWRPFSIADITDAQRASWFSAARSNYASCFSDLRVAVTQDRAYRETLDLCRDRGIRVALCLLPESPAFRACYTPAGQRQVREYAAALAKTYGTQVLDAWDWSDDEAEFPDGLHLLVGGAIRYSKRFGSEQLMPWVRGK